MTVLNLDELIVQKVKIQIGNEKIDIPVNDKNTLLISQYKMAIMKIVSQKDLELEKWSNKVVDDFVELEKNGKDMKVDYSTPEQMINETAEEMKAVALEYIDKIIGEGYGQKIYKHFGESTNALSATLNAISEEYERVTTSKEQEQEKYFVGENREQRRKKGKKKKQTSKEAAAMKLLEEALAKTVKE